MAIEFKTPPEKEIQTLQTFATFVDQAMTLLSSTPSLAPIAHLVAMKLQEALHWFTHGIMNPQVNAAIEITEAVATATGNQTLNVVSTVASEIEKGVSAVNSSNVTTPPAS